jgi:isoquinoline 1-oxidoreductase alpha subunit
MNAAREIRMTSFVVNGMKREVQAPTDTPLLYVLRNDLELSGPQFGCGMAQCGACSVLLNGKEVRSCITTLGSVTGKEVTTLEGLSARWAKQKGLSEAEAIHPVQAAWIEEQTPLCGFCQNGMMIKATELLEKNASPTVSEIKEAFTGGISPHLCRCGSYTAIIQAVQRASATMSKRSEA